MKLFKIRYGTNKQKDVRLSSVEFLSMVASKKPIWRPHDNTKRKNIANEAKRECWRQIAKELVGQTYLEASMKDRIDIEQGLKSRFHAMRDQWVKCRNRNKSYAFERHIKFLDMSEEDDDGNHSDNYSKSTALNEEEDAYIESPPTVDDNFIMEEEHIQIELAQPSTTTTSASYMDNAANIITEYSPGSSPAQIWHNPTTTPVELNMPSSITAPSSQPATPIKHQPFCTRDSSPIDHSCCCHCHKSPDDIKQQENYLFGKAIATLLNNFDGDKLFQTKKAMLSCIVKDVYILEPGRNPQH